MEFANLVAHGVAIIGNVGYGYELEHIVKGSFGEWPRFGWRPPRPPSTA